MMKQPSFPTIIAVEERRCNLSNPDLRFDESCLLVTSHANTPVTVLAQSVECIQCQLLEWASIEPATSVPLLIKSRYDVEVHFETSAHNSVCTLEQNFGERGLFSLDINNTNCGDLVTLREPDSAFLPMLILLVILPALGLLITGVARLVSSEWFKQVTFRANRVPTSEIENDLGSPSGSEGYSITFVQAQQAQRRQRTRVKSLDAFRGLCIILMIFVNYGGGKYNVFEHSVWNGLTIADILFPSFMWIMGVSLVLSMRSQLRSGVTRRLLTKRAIIRGLKLIAIGLALNSTQGRNSLATYRVCGVLQRLGICYLVVALMEAYQLRPQSPQLPMPRFAWLQDLRHAWPQWIVTVLLVGTQTAITFLLPVPGCPRGYLGPGGLHMQGNFFNCTGGAAGYIDRLVLGEEHLYPNPTCKKIYHTQINYDPEGLLGNLNGILLVQLGVQAGRVMLNYGNPWSRVSRWLVWAALTGLGGGALAGFAQEGGLIPINKNLFSLSFVLVNAGIDFAVLTFLYLLIDVKQWWTGAPFYFVGMNSLLVYIGHGFTGSMLPWKWQALGSTHAELLAMDAWAAAMWVLISYYLFHKNFFLVV